ncbi:hypothetical protein ANBU17_17000 [Anaerostipes butyraticus]|uniref:Uncharacterized protein n=1 Tax=Anaerostipes butyraticus TaxID=645466 RepID=A0A916QB15_9FIRM|nr:hypothetical protein ANBU17_17000 [Anaerostipes butyraticus]
MVMKCLRMMEIILLSNPLQIRKNGKEERHHVIMSFFGTETAKEIGRSYEKGAAAP